MRWQACAIAVAAGALLLVTGCTDDEPAAQVDLSRGEELYDRHCVACHGGSSGGAIDDIPPRHNAQGHTWHHADCDLIDMVLEGMPQREGFPEMPAFGDELTEAEVEAILAYIKTWWEPEQREIQAEITAAQCNGP